MPFQALCCPGRHLPVSMTPRTCICPKCGQHDPDEIRPVPSLLQVRCTIVGVALGTALLLLASAWAPPAGRQSPVAKRAPSGSDPQEPSQVRPQTSPRTSPSLDTMGMTGERSPAVNALPILRARVCALHDPARVPGNACASLRRISSSSWNTAIQTL